MFRVLITGSRAWHNEFTIFAVIMLLWEEHSDLVVVHGACPTGADHIADEVCRVSGILTEPHPADWSLGRKAGPLRNKEMIDTAPDLVVAFVEGESRGTRGTIELARAAGIKTRVFNANDYSYLHYN